MKNLFLILVLLLSYTHVWSQCMANSGIDKHSCPADIDANAIPIGANPTASNGTPPYIYSWSIEPIELGFPGSGIFLYASDVLNDTTISNPVITDRNAAQSISFYLKITDNLNCTSYDTCTVTFTNFFYHLMEYSYFITQGDSVFLNESPNVGVSTEEVLAYNWHPSYGLSNTNLATGFWASPDSSVSYYATIVDSMGCQATGVPFYHVYVNSVGLNNISLNDFVKIYPNPSKEYIKLDIPFKVKNIQLKTVAGKLVKNYNHMERILYVGDIAKGLYLLKLESKTGKASFKVVIE